MKPAFHQMLYGKNRFRLSIELALLYIALPLLIMLDIFPVPLMLVLIIMGLAVYFYLRYDPEFDRSTLINWEVGKKELRSILIMFIPAGVAMVVMIRIIDADKLFLLARTSPWFLLLISIFYPLFSVIPQGLAYRGLFFHRYGHLFPGRVSRMIISAAIFSFGHILYKNWVVLLLAFVAGLLFAWRYERSKSLAISILEHSLYGVWLFTCGLGYFFVSSFVD